ncbi:hypothetical protein BRE01_48910 [Brevibacillus reuszeri]|uniref:Uncharacterized protein n=1 Tax=Brevibacillus reuszeri TaxID=54915 RepID=A0ABQ0TTR7_9BACL|nr:hypothetical protein BRE01_48910 [Brevibacillus reuszeri]
MIELDYNLWPFTRLLIAMLICMTISVVIVMFITRRLPNALSRPLTYISPFAGAYVFFKYVSPLIN